MRANLYRHFDGKGILLYVGVSLNTLIRLGQHARNSAWFVSIKRVDVEQFETREAALIAEKKAIEQESPKHNTHHKKVNYMLAIEEKRHAVEISKQRLTSRIVEFDPLYGLIEAAALLQISTSGLKSLIAAGKIGHVRVPRGEGFRIKVTGWQLIEYLEYLQAEAKAA